MWERHHNDLIHREYEKPPGDRNGNILIAMADNIRDFNRREADRICEVLGIRKLYGLGWLDVVLTHLPWGE